MDYEQALRDIYDAVGNDQVEKAVLACLRVARMANDYLSAAVFMRELNPDNREVVRFILDDAPHMKTEAQKFISETSFTRWIEAHTIDQFKSEDEDLLSREKRNVLRVSVGEIDSEIDQCEKMIASMKVPPGMEPFDVAAFTAAMHREKSEIWLRMNAFTVLKSRIKARCWNYALEMEKQLGTQRKGQRVLEGIQNEVNNYFKAHSEDVFLKLQKASQLSISTDTEDSSLLLMEVRRALKAAADHFYPPMSSPVVCADGETRALGEEQYLNRLQEFLATQLVRSSAQELLRAELDHLAAFTRRLNDLASKGVHAQTTFAEAKQGLVGLYFFLFNVCQHISLKDECDD